MVLWQATLSRQKFEGVAVQNTAGFMSDWIWKLCLEKRMMLAIKRDDNGCKEEKQVNTRIEFGVEYTIHCRVTTQNIQTEIRNRTATYLKQGAAASDVHTQVASNIVVGLSAILHKIGVTRDVIGNIVAHLKTEFRRKSSREMGEKRPINFRREHNCHIYQTSRQ